MSNFETNNNKGFAMTFANGWTISVQWGIGNYCSAGRISDDYRAPRAVDSWTSDTAEIAVWDSKGDFYQCGESDDVLGYLTTDEVAQWIEKVSKF